MPPVQHTQVHGHRGCAGPFPANALPAFLEATRAGCHFLEMDVVITGDAQVLVSHEPWMDHLACLDPEGRVLSEPEGRAANIHRMSVEEVQRYRLMPGDGPARYKPTLAEVVEAVRNETALGDKSMPRFNIEMKSDPEQYGTYQPEPAEFIQLLVQEIHALGLDGHCLIQSFDPAILMAANRADPSIPLALLVDNAANLEVNLALLDFTPAYYSPESHLIDQPLVEALRQKGIGLLAWTVNEKAEMRRMIGLGVDGLITDRPTEALALLAAHP